MPDRHEVFQVTAPAATLAAAPLEVNCGFDPGEVRRVDIRIAAGHSAKTGIQIAAAHQQVVPWSKGAWIVGDAREKEYDIQNMPHGGQWSAIVYNADTIAHYWEITFHVDNIAEQRYFDSRGYAMVSPFDVHRLRDLMAGGT